MTAGERARREIRKAAERTAQAEEELKRLEQEMLDAGVAPELDRREAVAEAAHRLSVLAESLAHLARSAVDAVTALYLSLVERGVERTRDGARLHPAMHVVLLRGGSGRLR